MINRSLSFFLKFTESFIYNLFFGLGLDNRFILRYYILTFVYNLQICRRAYGAETKSQLQGQVSTTIYNLYKLQIYLLINCTYLFIFRKTFNNSIILDPKTQ